MSRKKSTKQEELAIRVLKVAKCPSNSGKATLTYQIGCDEQSAIYMRVLLNSSSGYFNPDWKAYAAIREALDKEGKDAPVTSHALTPLYKFQSTNSPAFLFATLKAEGLVESSKIKKRAYDKVSDAAFLTGIRKLIEGKPVAEAVPKPKPAKNKESVAIEAATQPLFVLSDVPDNKPVKAEGARRGRPKKAAPMADAVVPEVASVEGAQFRRLCGCAGSSFRRSKSGNPCGTRDSVKQQFNTNRIPTQAVFLYFLALSQKGTRTQIIDWVRWRSFAACTTA